MILSLIGPSDYHDANNDYKITPTDEKKRTKSAYYVDGKDVGNGKEMISFVPQKTDDNIDGDVA